MTYREQALRDAPGTSLVTAKVELAVPASFAAQLCAQFWTLHEWHPAFGETHVEGDGVGAVRTIDMGGTPVRERLEHIADDGSGYFYSVVSHPLLPAGTRGFIEVREGASEGTSELEWTIALGAGGGLIPAASLEGLVKGLCEMGLQAAKVRLEDDSAADAWPEDEVTIPDARRR